MDDFDFVLSQAKAIAERETKSPYHRAAFANSVAYLVTGWSGGFGGPSIREHLCSHAVMGKEGFMEVIDGFPVLFPDGTLPHPSKWGTNEAISFCSPICFGELSRYALKIVEVEYCFDDDPKDLKQISEWEKEELANLLAEKKIGKLKQPKFLRLKYLKSKHNI